MLSITITSVSTLSVCELLTVVKGDFCLQQLICSYVFMPVAFMMGIPFDESFTVAKLIGIKLFLNEFIAYEKLSELKNNRLNNITEVGKYISVSCSICSTLLINQSDVFNYIIHQHKVSFWRHLGFCLSVFSWVIVIAPFLLNYSGQVRDHQHLRSVRLC